MRFDRAPKTSNSAYNIIQPSQYNTVSAETGGWWQDETGERQQEGWMERERERERERVRERGSGWSRMPQIRNPRFNENHIVGNGRTVNKDLRSAVNVLARFSYFLAQIDWQLHQKSSFKKEDCLGTSPRRRRPSVRPRRSPDLPVMILPFGKFSWIHTVARPSSILISWKNWY